MFASKTILLIFLSFLSHFLSLCLLGLIYRYFPIAFPIILKETLDSVLRLVHGREGQVGWRLLHQSRWEVVVAGIRVAVRLGERAEHPTPALLLTWTLKAGESGEGHTAFFISVPQLVKDPAPCRGCGVSTCFTLQSCQQSLVESGCRLLIFGICIALLSIFCNICIGNCGVCSCHFPGCFSRKIVATIAFWYILRQI